jgi:hypothetical protein
MHDHIAALAEEFGADVEFRPGGAQPGVSDARLWLHERRIVAPPVRTRREYFMVLHEFGHLASQPIGYALHDEAAAWLWALGTTCVEPSARVWRMIDGVMHDYACFRLGYSGLAEARQSLPEPLRLAVVSLYDALEAGLRGSRQGGRESL